MSSESSVVARKLHNYIEIQNAKPSEVAQEQIEKGLFTQLIVVVLMSLACGLTKLTLYTTRLIKRLER